MFKNNKKSSDKKNQKLLEEKYKNKYVKSETTVIDVNAFKNTKSLSTLAKSYQKLSDNELIYKLENEKLSKDEKKIIDQILKDRER
ncbi:MAG: hypothetical protein HUJ42_03310 [Malacoplasma sp.]|nr:hypothetical protein [Malacoplasma sp.]